MSWLMGKGLDAGKDWGQEKRATGDEMVGWHHRLNGHEFEQIPGVGDGQGGLACCSPWGRKELDTTERLNWTDSDLMLKNIFSPKLVTNRLYWFRSQTRQPLVSKTCCWKHNVMLLKSAFKWSRACDLKLEKTRSGWYSLDHCSFI